MRTPAIRLLLTLALPLLLVLAADRVLLPGMDAVLDTLGRRGADFFVPWRSNVSVFALGITPVIAAYGIVELTALIVPRWSRLRHGNPEGRAKLERAARAVSIALAVVQAWGVATMLARLDSRSGIFETGADFPPSWLVVATLVGGVCVQIVVAEIVSRLGFANGYVALLVMESLVNVWERIQPQLQKGLILGAIEPKHIALLALTVLLPIVATWSALRGADRMRDATPVKQKKSASDAPAPPYRDARALAVSPWVPVPSSSVSPYAIALALVTMPGMVAPWLGARSAGNAFMSFMSERVPFAIATVLVTLVLVVVFSRLLHRPREMADVASRVGRAAGAEMTEQARAALTAAFRPTLFFFATLLAASSAAVALPVAFPILFVPLLVALVMDLANAGKSATRVSVWQERRASAVPIVRAVLAAEGIDAGVRGLYVLSLLQLLAPYAAAEIVVDPADAEKATSVLRHVFLGEKRAEAEPNDALPKREEPAPWSASRRNAVLGITAALSMVVLVLANVRSPAAGAGVAELHRLELVRVDDESTVIAQLQDATLPTGVEIRFENAPLGPGHTGRVYFARTEMRSGESFASASERLRSWADTLVLPAGRRIGIEPVDDYDADTNKTSLIGARTFVLEGEPVISGDDVEDAAASMNDQNGMPEVYVAVTLTKDGGERFRVATRALIQRRFAIVVDGQIRSAPVVKSEIGGGHLSITMGAGDTERQLAQAKALAASLRHSSRKAP